MNEKAWAWIHISCVTLGKFGLFHPASLRKHIAQNCWGGLGELLPIKGQTRMYRWTLGASYVMCVKGPDGVVGKLLKCWMF